MATPIRERLAVLRSPAFLAVVPLAATLAVQGMVLGSGLVDEDYFHLYGIQRLGVGGYFLHSHAGHFVGSFVLLSSAIHGVFGLHSFPYFGAVLALHLLNVALLFDAARALSGSGVAAAVGASLWGAAPAFQETLQIYCALNHVMSQTGLLWAIAELARSAETGRPPAPAALLRMNVALIIGAATQMAATLITVVFPGLVLLLLGRREKQWRSAFALAPSALAALGMVFWVLHQAAAASPSPAPPLLIPLGTIATLFATLLAYGAGVVLAGPFFSFDARQERTSLFQGSLEHAARGGAFLLVAVIGLLAWYLVRVPQKRRPILALITLSSMSYAIISLGRAGANGPLSTAAHMRYHYDGTVGLVLASAIAAAELGRRITWRPGRVLRLTAPVFLSGWMLASLVAARRTYFQVETRQHWARDWSELADACIRRFVVRSPAGSTVYTRNDSFMPAGILYAMGIPKAELPGVGALWILEHGTGSVTGRIVRFVEPDDAVLAQIRAKSRPEVASMFVPSSEVRRHGGNEQSVLHDSPVPAADYLSHAIDPLFRTNDAAWADRARRSLAAGE